MGAWHGVDSERKHLGRFGALATFSFHETKNITSGEGGVVNQDIGDGRAMRDLGKGHQPSGRPSSAERWTNTDGWMPAAVSCRMKSPWHNCLDNLNTSSPSRAEEGTFGPAILSDSPTRCPRRICPLIGGRNQWTSLLSLRQFTRAPKRDAAFVEGVRDCMPLSLPVSAQKCLRPAHGLVGTSTECRSIHRPCSVFRCTWD